MSIAGVLRRADDRLLQRSNRLFGTGPLSRLWAAFAASAVVAVPVAAVGRWDLLRFTAFPMLLGGGLGSAIVYFVNQHGVVRQLSAEVRQLRDELAKRTAA
jgi:hypothetical protein